MTFVQMGEMIGVFMRAGVFLFTFVQMGGMIGVFMCADVYLASFSLRGVQIVSDDKYVCVAYV